MLFGDYYCCLGMYVDIIFIIAILDHKFYKIEFLFMYSYLIFVFVCNSISFFIISSHLFIGSLHIMKTWFRK